jgi:alpha,alpha-trehalase
MRKLLLVLALLAQAQAQLQPAPAVPQTPIRAYIASGWETLSRSMFECKSVVDPKVTTTPILYLPAHATGRLGDAAAMPR